MIEQLAREVPEQHSPEERAAPSVGVDRRILDGLMEGCLVVGFDWRCLYVNGAATRQAGRKPEDLLGRTLTEIFPGIGKAAHFAHYRRCMEERARQHFEAEFSFPGLASKWLEVSLSPVPDGVFALSIDVTERRKAEQELRLSEQRHRLLADCARDVVWTMEPDGRISYVGPAVEKVRGFSSAEAMGQTLGEIHPPASQRVSLEYFERVRAAVEAGRTPESFRGELEYLCRDGSTVWTEVLAFPLLGADGTLLQVLGVTRDIDERRRAEAALRESEERYRKLSEELESRILARTAELTDASRELEAYSHSISHELRAPLRAIDGHVAMIGQEYEVLLDGEGRRHLGQVRWNAQRMGRLIDDLLAFSRAGRADLTFGPVDMTGAAKATFARVVTDPASLSRISFSVGLLPEAVGDADLLHRVWENLLSNAVKFSAGRENPEIRVEGGVEGGEAVYRVRDNGTGFDMQYVDKLFGVFQRLHGIREFEGTGVGLALVRRIVMRHGGQVWAEGELDRGATFSFTLPARNG